MRAFIAYRNQADGIALTSNQTPHAGYPLSNVQTRQSDEFTRLPVTSFGATTCDIDLFFSAAVRPAFVGLFGLNASEITSNMIALLRDLTTAESITIAPDAGVPDLPKDVKVPVPAGPTSDRWRIRLNWPRVGGVDYFELARLWFAFGSGILELPKGVDAVWELDVVERGEVDVTPSEVVFEDRRVRPRIVRARIGTARTETAFGFDDTAASAAGIASAQDCQMHVGRTGEIVIAHRAEPIWMHRCCFRGRLDQGLKITHRAGRIYTLNLGALEEL